MPRKSNSGSTEVGVCYIGSRAPCVYLFVIKRVLLWCWGTFSLLVSFLSTTPLLDHPLFLFMFCGFNLRGTVRENLPAHDCEVCRCGDSFHGSLCFFVQCQWTNLLRFRILYLKVPCILQSPCPTLRSVQRPPTTLETLLPSL